MSEFHSSPGIPVRTAILLLLAAGVALAQLPAPNATPSAVKFPKVIDWPADKMPTAPAGFIVSLFADKLDSPRWMYQLPNGDVLVAESKTEPKPLKEAEAKPEFAEGAKKARMAGKSANRITLFRMADGGKVERHVFAENLKQPLGMALVGDALFVGCTNAVVRFPYKAGQTKLEGAGMKVMDLPEGGYNNHWTRNVLANKDGTKLYVSVGSASNVAERGTAEELLRACVLEMNPDGTGLRVFASGLRNPAGMDWEPTTGTLWTAVNERDELVPDYLTSVKDGAFYGWPYSYFGKNEDPRRKGERPDLVAKAVAPEVPLGSHTASLGLAFYRGEAFPEKYRGGAFVGQHGSWNRSDFSGYKVVFVPFKDGKPAGKFDDFLTGFIANKDDVYGRPVGVTVLKDGSMLVADDAANRIWRVTVGGQK